MLTKYQSTLLLTFILLYLVFVDMLKYVTLPYPHMSAVIYMPLTALKLTVLLFSSTSL